MVISLISCLLLFTGSTAAICALCCTLSIMFTHGAGNYIFTLFDDFSGNVPLLIIAFFECIAVSYVYGVNRCVHLNHSYIHYLRYICSNKLLYYQV